MKFSTRFIEMLGEQEAPASYLRWSIISAYGAALARNAYSPFGYDRIYPNQYIILMGVSGARKNTGPRIVEKLLKQSGYVNFAPNKGRKEALWTRLVRYGRNDYGMNAVPGELDVEEMDLDEVLGEDNKPKVAHMYILAPEWISFVGYDNELVVNLTDLWDNKDDWDYERTTKENLLIHAPTLNMLGGATPTSFAEVVPPTAIGGGFMRRLLLIHGEQCKKIDEPSIPNITTWEYFIHELQALQAMRDREVTLTTESRAALKTIYHMDTHIADGRFDSYTGVRHTHLRKLCLISACARDSSTISVDDVVESNTILTRAEIGMPHALGHFGIAAGAQATNIVLDSIRRAQKAPNLRELYKKLGADVGTLEKLKDHLALLRDTGKIDVMKSATGNRYMPVTELSDEMMNSPFFDQTILTAEEKV
jgi:hypothetical protein